MRKVILIFFLSIRVLTYLHAQEKLDISGKVTDSVGTALSVATVCLPLSHDTLRVVTRADGSFHFQIPEASSFELLVTMKGYAPFRKNFSAPQDSHLLNLPPLVLKTSYGDLAPVTVIGVKPIRIREDTVEFYAAAFSVRPGDELEYLLKKFPGLHVMMDGTVIFQGKKVGIIRLNGRDFVGGDVAIAIRNLPADIVESIQLIDDYGDKGRLTGVKSGKADKVLNIVLKQDRRNGKFGRVEAGAGNKDKYNAALFSGAIKENRQLTLNAWLRDTILTGNDHEKGVYFGYSDRWNKKWSGGGGLGIWGDNQSSGNSMTQDNFYPGSRTHLQQSSRTNGNSQNSGISYKIEYQPDHNTLMRIIPSLYTWNSSVTISSDLSSSESDSNFRKNTKGNSINCTNDHKLLGGSDLYFERSYPVSGRRLSFTGGVHYSNEQQDCDQQTNTLVHTDSLDYASRQHYLFHAANFNKDLTAALNYYLPLGESAFLELGYSGHYSFTQSDKLTQVPDNTTFHLIRVDSLSNDYSFSIMTNRLHAGYMANSKKLNLTISLDAQPTSQSGQTAAKGSTLNYHYFNILPLVQLSWSFSPSQKLNLDYSGNSQPPSIQQLQPVTDLNNPQYPVTGNPSLKPPYTHTVGLHYEQSTVLPARFPAFGIDLKYNTVQNMIIANITHSHDTSAVAQRTTWSNINGFHSFTAGYHLDFPYFLHKRLRVTTSGAVSNDQSISLMDNVLYPTNSLNWSQALNLKLNISNIVEYEVWGNYMHSTTRYADSTSTPTSFSSASWAFQGRHFLFKKWVFDYSVTQSFTSGTSPGLQTNPALLNASVQCQFFANNQLTLRFSGYDLLNSSTGNSQSVTPTSIIQNRTVLIGRYFLLSFVLKFEKFRK